MVIVDHHQIDLLAITVGGFRRRRRGRFHRCAVVIYATTVVIIIVVVSDMIMIIMHRPVSFSISVVLIRLLLTRVNFRRLLVQVLYNRTRGGQLRDQRQTLLVPLV